MNLDELKGKTIDEATHAALVEYVTGLQSEVARERSKVQQARDESANHRKGLKAKVEELERVNRVAFDRLGIDSPEELETLPDGKGQAEKVQQLEAQIKRLTREKEETAAKVAELTTEREINRRKAAISEAVKKHSFIDPEVASRLLADGITVDDDQIMFKDDSGKLVPLDEGAAWLAKSKPFLVKAQGGAGSGYRGGDAGGGGGQLKKPERKDYTDEVAYFRDSAKYHEQTQQAS